jgi:hypothetical protein
MQYSKLPDLYTIVSVFLFSPDTAWMTKTPDAVILTDVKQEIEQSIMSLAICLPELSNKRNEQLPLSVVKRILPTSLLPS